MSTETKRIFIAGHMGLVGQAFVRRFQSEDRITLILRPHEQLDLTNQTQVTRFFKNELPDSVIMAAARVGGIRANSTYPADFIYENLMIESNIIHQAWLQGVQDLLFFGSTCIYPRRCPQPMQEEALLTGPLEPTNEAYAMAKLSGWKLCEIYNRQYGTRFRTLLPTNLYGPHDNFHPEHSHVIPALLQRFQQAKEEDAPEVVIWGSGEARREFLHVDDLVDACFFLEKHPEVLGPVNIGSRQEVSIRELAETLRDVVGFAGELHFDKSKPDGMPLKKVDTNQMDKLGWKSHIHLSDGLEQTYSWFLQSQENLRK